MSTERKYLALHDELTSVFNNEIVVKKKQVEGTTLGDMALGSTVYLDEGSEGTTSWASYNVVEKRENAVAILKAGYTSIYLSPSTKYENGAIDTYLNGTFINGFKSSVRNLFIEQTIKYVDISVSPAYMATVSRKVFIPSSYELNGTDSLGFNDGDANWNGYYDLRPYTCPSYFYWLRSFYNQDGTIYQRAVYADESRSWISYESWGETHPVRPAIWVSTNAIVDTTDGNKIQASADEPYESTELDTVRVDDKKYKIKDLEARTLINGKYTKPASGIPASDMASGVIPDISSKLDANQGSANSGKFMKVGADGALTPDTIPTPTSSYNDLTNKPTLNGVTITGAKTSADFGLAAQHIKASVTLTTAGWDASTKLQTVSVTGLSATDDVLVGPVYASATDWAEGNVLCSAQASGSLTFHCDTIPTNAISATALIFGTSATLADTEVY